MEALAQLKNRLCGNILKNAGPSIRAEFQLSTIPLMPKTCTPTVISKRSFFIRTMHEKIN